MGVRVVVRRLVVVFVSIGPTGGDRFYVLTWNRLRDILVRLHKTWLAKHNGVRPKKWDSLHCAISEKELARYRDAWDTVKKNLR